MNPKYPNFEIDPAFDEFFAKAGGFTTPLDNAGIQKVSDQFKAYLKAKEMVLADQINYRFNADKFEPEVLSTNIVILLDANITEYNFANYQVLQDTLLVGICFPQANSFTTYFGGKAIVPFAGLCQGFLTLSNDRQQKFRDKEPVLDYVRDSAVWPEKGRFKNARTDWTTSQIEFPDATIPTANDGDVIIMVVEYIDMKRYPYLQKKK